MYSLTIMFMLTLVITLLLSLMAVTLNKKTLYSSQKLSPFECGFDPKTKSQAPFSLRFFLITIMFLIFDIEIVLLLPLSIVQNLTNTLYMSLAIILIILILLYGLMYEWHQGMLTWL